MRNTGRIKRGRHKFTLYLETKSDRDMFERFRILLRHTGVSEANMFRDMVMDYLSKHVEELKAIDYDLVGLNEIFYFIRRQLKIVPQVTDFVRFRSEFLIQGVDYFVEEMGAGEHKRLRYLYRSDTVEEKLREKFTVKKRRRLRRAAPVKIIAPTRPRRGSAQ